MLVKAKWNVKDSNGWHEPGEVFQTEDDLHDNVIVLEAAKPEPVQEPAKEPETEPKAEPEAEPTKAEAPKTARRKRSSK